MRKNSLTFVLLSFLVIFTNIEVNAQCDASAGTIAPLSNSLICQDGSNADVLEVMIPTAAETNSTDYIIAVSEMHPDSSIIGLTTTGGFDFTDDGTGNPYPLGTYCFTGFAYTQAELDDLAADLNPLLPLLSFPPIPIPADIESVFGIIELALGGISIPDVEEGINVLIPSLGFDSPCVGISEAPYCIELVEDCSVAPVPDNNECDEPATLFLPFGGDPVFYGPYDNTDATSEATDPVAPDCWGEPQGLGGAPEINNSLWFTFVGDGSSYHIYVTDQCGPTNLTDEGTFITEGDTQMAIYTGECDDLTMIACNDDDPSAGAEPGYYVSGLNLETVLGETYTMMIDGFNFTDADGNSFLSIGEYCIQFDPIDACAANVDLDPVLPTVVDLCSDDELLLAIDSTTLVYGPVTDNPGTVWSLFSVDPMGDPFGVAPENSLGLFLGFPTNPTFSIPGTTNGLDPITGTLPTIWAVGITVVSVDLVAGTIDFGDCVDFTEAIQINFLADGTGDCPSAIDCSTANIELDATVPASPVDLCPGEGFTILSDVNTLNFGPEADDPTLTPLVLWLLTSTDPAGDPLGVPDAEFLGLLFGDLGDTSTPIAHADTTSTFWVTGGTFFMDEYGDLLIPECVTYAASVQVNFLSADDPACTGGDPLATTDPVTEDDGMTYTVSFDIFGGSGGYEVDGVAVDGSFTSAAIPCGEPYSFTVADSDSTFLVVAGEAPCAAGCDVTATVISTLSETTFCTDDGIEDIVVVDVAGGSSDDSFGFIITDSDLNILSDGLVDGPVFDFETVPAGTCLIWAISYDGELTGTEMGENAYFIEGCFEVSEPIAVTRLTGEDCDGDCDVTATIISTLSETTFCTDDGIEDIVVVDVAGGSSDDSFGFIITDSDLNILSDGLVDGPVFDFETVPAGTCLIWAISYDGELTGTEMGENAYFIEGCFEVSEPIAVTRLTGDDCVVECTADAGTLPSDDIFVCGGETATATSTGFALGAGDVLTYYLHSNSGDPQGSALASNDNGTFSFDDLVGGAYNEDYFISAVAGPDSGDGTPIIGDDCTVSAAGPAVIFFAPIEVSITIDCDNTAGDFTVAFTITGGLPEYDNSFEYSVTGDFGGSVTFDNELVAGPFADGANFVLNVTDDFACSETLFQPSIPCTKCNNLPGDMEPAPGDDPQYICDGDFSFAIANNVTVDTVANAILVYVLHDNADDLGAILATNAVDGSFTFADLTGGANNTIYYISSLVGPDDDGDGVPDLDNVCTVASVGTPVVFLAPINIMFDFDCDHSAGEGVLSFNISGGLPSFDSGTSYTLSGVTFGSFSIGDAMPTVNVGDGEAWQLNVIDQNDCTASESGIIECEKVDYVVWLGFTGEVMEQGNMLRWTTAVEVENEKFTVERSPNGQVFEVVGTVAGAGTVELESNYQFLDTTAPAGLSYYKITQHDFDGSTESTNYISLIRGEVKFSINSIQPVPATHTLNVVFHAVQDMPVSVEVYDLTGRKVYTNTTGATLGVNAYSIDVANYSAGVYFISINDGIEVVTQKFVKD